MKNQQLTNDMRSFIDADEKFETHSFPATTTELIEAYGETELKLANGTETIETVLSRYENQTFVDAEDARLAAYGAVSEKAIGRKYYSDRDPFGPGAEGPEQLSF